MFSKKGFVMKLNILNEGKVKVIDKRWAFYLFKRDSISFV